MILGIICLILVIGGFFLSIYGNDDGNFLRLALGIVLISIGIVGMITFIGINSDTIKSWFRI